MEKKDTFATKVGQFVAHAFVACIAACLTACAVALTIRFIAWLF